MPAWLLPVLHTVVALALLATYATLWALGHQDPVLLGVLGGQLGGLGVTQLAQQATVAVAAPASTSTTVTLTKPLNESN